ncbi:hypothetical protein [Clostridium butyricum]
MKIKIKYIVIVLLMLSAFAKICLNNILIKRINIKPVSAQVIKKYKDLTQLNREISELNNTSILSADKKNNIWYTQLKISGDKQIILEEIKKLEKYEINNYIISKNNTENCVIIDICGNE